MEVPGFGQARGTEDFLIGFRMDPDLAIGAASLHQNVVFTAMLIQIMRDLKRLQGVPVEVAGVGAPAAEPAIRLAQTAPQNAPPIAPTTAPAA